MDTKINTNEWFARTDDENNDASDIDDFEQEHNRQQGQWRERQERRHQQRQQEGKQQRDAAQNLLRKKDVKQEIFKPFCIEAQRKSQEEIVFDSCKRGNGGKHDDIEVMETTNYRPKGCDDGRRRSKSFTSQQDNSERQTKEIVKPIEYEISLALMPCPATTSIAVDAPTVNAIVATDTIIPVSEALISPRSMDCTNNTNNTGNICFSSNIGGSISASIPVTKRSVDVSRTSNTATEIEACLFSSTSSSNQDEDGGVNEGIALLSEARKKEVMTQSPMLASATLDWSAQVTPSTGESVTTGQASIVSAEGVKSTMTAVSTATTVPFANIDRSKSLLNRQDQQIIPEEDPFVAAQRRRQQQQLTRKSGQYIKSPGPISQNVKPRWAKKVFSSTNIPANERSNQQQKQMAQQQQLSLTPLGSIREYGDICIVDVDNFIDIGQALDSVQGLSCQSQLSMAQRQRHQQTQSITLENYRNIIINNNNPLFDLWHHVRSTTTPSVLVRSRTDSHVATASSARTLLLDDNTTSMSLGYLSFGLTTAILMIEMLMVDAGEAQEAITIGFVLFVGGFLQIFAGSNERKRNNLFGYTAFCFYGACYMALAVAIVIPAVIAIIEASDNTDMMPPMTIVRTLYVLMTISGLVFWIATYYLHNSMVFWMFSALVLSFVCLSIGGGNGSGMNIWNSLGIVLGLITSLISLYLAFAELLNGIQKSRGVTENNINNDEEACSGSASMGPPTNDDMGCNPLNIESSLDDGKTSSSIVSDNDPERHIEINCNTSSSNESLHQLLRSINNNQINPMHESQFGGPDPFFDTEEIIFFKNTNDIVDDDEKNDDSCGFRMSSRRVFDLDDEGTSGDEDEKTMERIYEMHFQQFQQPNQEPRYYSEQQMEQKDLFKNTNDIVDDDEKNDDPYGIRMSSRRVLDLDDEGTSGDEDEKTMERIFEMHFQQFQQPNQDPRYYSEQQMEQKEHSNNRNFNNNVQYEDNKLRDISINDRIEICYDSRKTGLEQDERRQESIQQPELIPASPKQSMQALLTHTEKLETDKKNLDLTLSLVPTPIVKQQDIVEANELEFVEGYKKEQEQDLPKSLGTKVTCETSSISSSSTSYSGTSSNDVKFEAHDNQSTNRQSRASEKSLPNDAISSSSIRTQRSSRSSARVSRSTRMRSISESQNDVLSDSENGSSRSRKFSQIVDLDIAMDNYNYSDDISLTGLLATGRSATGNHDNALDTNDNSNTRLSGMYDSALIHSTLDKYNYSLGFINMDDSDHDVADVSVRGEETEGTTDSFYDQYPTEELYSTTRTLSYDTGHWEQHDNYDSGVIAHQGHTMDNTLQDALTCLTNNNESVDDMDAQSRPQAVQISNSSDNRRLLKEEVRIRDNSFAVDETNKKNMALIRTTITPVETRATKISNNSGYEDVDCFISPPSYQNSLRSKSIEYIHDTESLFRNGIDECIDAQSPVPSLKNYSSSNNRRLLKEDHRIYEGVGGNDETNQNHLANSRTTMITSEMMLTQVPFNSDHDNRDSFISPTPYRSRHRSTSAEYNIDSTVGKSYLGNNGNDITTKTPMSVRRSSRQRRFQSLPSVNTSSTILSDERMSDRFVDIEGIAVTLIRARTNSSMEL